MDERKQVKVKINALGNPTVEAVGYSGSECMGATKNFEDALAAPGSIDVVTKPEYYQEADAATEQSAHTSW